MKILTRYILFNYIRNYLISLFVLIGLYVVLDMVFNFDEFAVSQKGGGAMATVGNVIEYYFYQSFLIFAQLSGVIPVAAAAFTFLRFARFNELTAMMAAGMHLVRVAAPAIFCAVIASLIMPLINQELIIPNIIPELTRARSADQVLGEGRQKSFPVQNMQDSQKNLLFAARYEPPGTKNDATLTEMIVLHIDWGDDVNPLKAEFISAPKAIYKPERQEWELTNGTLTTGLGIGQRNRKVTPVDTYTSNVTPEEIALYRSGDFVNLLSTSRINQLLDPDRRTLYGTNDLLRVKHARLAQLLVNIILVLLAISCVLIRELGQFRFAVMKCIILVGFCMATVFMCQNFAGNPPEGAEWADRWPALMAWMPIFIFGPLSVFLMDRVKT